LYNVYAGGFEQPAVVTQELKGQKGKETTGKLRNGQLLSGYGFVQNVALPSLSRDKRIKMKRTNKQTVCNFVNFFAIYRI